MLRLLDRAMLRDLLRLGLLTTAVLVTVIAFGAAIKPLASDRLITAAQAAKYIGLVAVPMLQFALPFAAAFAATLLLHRMTADNEILAMASSGIPYRRILRPVLLLGLVLLVVMVGLTQWVIPRFWTRLQRTISTDVVQMFQLAIGRGEPFQLGNLQIYADELAVQTDPPGSDADTRLVLLRVAAAELDDRRRIVTDVTASQAVIDIYRRPGRTLLKLAMTDTVVFNHATGQLVRTDEVRPQRAIVVPDLVEDDPMTMTQPQLLALRGDPDRFSKVVEARTALDRTLRDGAALDGIAAALAADGTVVFVQAGPEPRRFVVEASGLRGRRFRPEGQAVRVTEFIGDEAMRRYAFTTALLERTGTGRLSTAAWDLVLEDGEVADLRRADASNRRARLVLPALTVAGEGDADAPLPSSAALIARARETGGDAPARRASKLGEEIREVQDEIVGRLHRRYALSFTAPLLLLLGATLAMWRRNSLPLTIYLWAFVPSILDLVLISSGDQMLRDGHAEGLAVLWSGNVALAGLTGFAYWRLARN